DRDLPARIVFENLRPITALGTLERIATLVVAPGLGVFGPILERFAEREAQVKAVNEQRGGRCLLGAHASNFLIAETVGLEVGQTPVRLAEAWPDAHSGPVGLDSLAALAQGLQCVS